jgi:hypothetical protein
VGAGVRYRCALGHVFESEEPVSRCPEKTAYTGGGWVDDDPPYPCEHPVKKIEEDPS